MTKDLITLLLSQLWVVFARSWQDYQISSINSCCVKWSVVCCFNVCCIFQERKVSLYYIVPFLSVLYFNINLTFVCPCVVSIIVNYDQQDATILANLFIPNRLYMFWATSSPVIRSAWLYLQHLILSTGNAASWWTISDAVNTVNRSWW